MLKAKGLSFGSGMTQIYAQPQELETFDIRRPRRQRQTRREMSARECAIIISVIAPVIFGLTFLTVMIPHTALYIAYWLTCWTWAGIVVYANTTRRQRHDRG